MSLRLRLQGRSTRPLNRRMQAALTQTTLVMLWAELRRRQAQPRLHERLADLCQGVLARAPRTRT